MPHLWTGGSRCGWSTWVIFNKGRWFGENNPTQTTESWKVSEANSMFNALMSAGCFDTCARMGTAGLDGSSFAWWWYDLTIWWLLWKIKWSSYYQPNHIQTTILCFLRTQVMGVRNSCFSLRDFPVDLVYWPHMTKSSGKFPSSHLFLRGDSCGVFAANSFSFILKTSSLDFWGFNELASNFG